MKKKEKERSIMRRAAEMLEIPPETVLKEPYIKWSGKASVTVENHRGIIEYGDELVRLSGGKNIISISGARLTIRSMTSYEITLFGRIDKIEMT